MTGVVVDVEVDVVDVVNDGGNDEVDVVGTTMTGPVVVGEVEGVTIAGYTAEKHHTTAPAAMTPGATTTSRRAIAQRCQSPAAPCTELALGGTTSTPPSQRDFDGHRSGPPVAASQDLHGGIWRCVGKPR